MPYRSVLPGILQLVMAPKFDPKEKQISVAFVCLGNMYVLKKSNVLKEIIQQNPPHPHT